MKRYGLIFVLLLFSEVIITEPLVVYSESNQPTENIEIYRKGNIILRFFNQNKNLPLPNCKITLNQINHDFIFYACPMGKYNQYDARYANLLKEAGMNSSNLIMTWGSIQPEPNYFEWGAIDSYQNIETQLSNGFKLLGGITLWWNRGGSLGTEFCPLYLDNMNFDELKTITNNHMYEIVNRYNGKIDYWEFNEQNASWTNPLDLTWRQKLEINQVASLGIKNVNAEAKIIYTANALPNEFGWPPSVGLDDKATGVQFPEFLQMIVDYGIPFDAIGLEFYYAGKNQDGYIPPTLDIEALSDLIDLYSYFNKSIIIRELSAPSEQVKGTSMWQGLNWDEDVQADYLKQVYTMAFSKQLVKGIGYSYGVSDEDSYIISGGILDENLNPKRSYYALKDLINSWTTSGDCITDERGECIFRGFAGDYIATITTPSGYNLQANVHIYEQRTVETTVTTAGLIYFPHIASNSKWETEICIINTSSEQSLSGDLRAYNDSGQEVSLTPVILAANGRREIIIGDELPNPSDIGYIIFESDSENVIGYTKFYTEGKYRVAVPAVSDVNTGDIYISHIASNTNWWTGVSLLNTTSSSKELTV